MRNMFKSMKLWATALLILTFLLVSPVQALAASYTIQPNDTLWKIATKHQVGLNEIIRLNPHLSNPNMIYPYQTIQIPGQAEQAPSSVSEWEQAVADLVNQERAKAGLPALQIDADLSNVARYKSADMRDRNYFSHDSPTYGSPFDMMQQFGIDYNSAGENIAAGQTSPEAVMEAWMNSPGHRQNIMNPNYTHIGIGYVSGGSYKHYWTQQFVGR